MYTLHGCTSNTDRSAVNNPEKCIDEYFPSILYTEDIDIEQQGPGIENGSE